MSEALARGSEDVGGFLHLVLLVTGRLSILDQRCLLLLTHFVKLFLGFFELTNVTAKEMRNRSFVVQLFSKSSVI